MDIQTQIEKLQKQAADIKAREFDSTVQEIRAKMQAFGITVKDLQTVKRGTKGKGKKDVAPKILGPNGETWSGRGLTPLWLAALLEQGRTKDEFAVKS